MQSYFVFSLFAVLNKKKKTTITIYIFFGVDFHINGSFVLLFCVMVYMPLRFQGRCLLLWKKISLLDSSLTLSQKSAVIIELAAVRSPAPLFKSSISILRLRLT